MKELSLQIATGGVVKSKIPTIYNEKLLLLLKFITIIIILLFGWSSTECWEFKP
jgi:hypothetical protein